MGHQFDGMKQGQAGFWPPLIQQQQKKNLNHSAWNPQQI
jgi:hypothetical protein